MDPLPLTLFYWLPLLAFLVHVAEEWPRFPAWATRHFGATSRPFYLYSHVVLIAVGTLVCQRAAAQGPGGPWAMLATAMQHTLLTNGLFHLATTVLFREYSPGVVTGTLLFLPLSAYMG